MTRVPLIAEDDHAELSTLVERIRGQRPASGMAAAWAAFP